MKLTNDQRLVTGFVLLALALILIASGANLLWGLTGALWVSGIVLAIYGVGFLISASD
jgi:hypothetical protein